VSQKTYGKNCQLDCRKEPNIKDSQNIVLKSSPAFTLPLACFKTQNSLFYFKQDVPLCSTIQNQLNPDLPFNSIYVTWQYQSYVKAIGNYENKSVPLGSSVNLSCYFEGKKE